MNLMRNMDKEKQVESEISKILRERFSFRYIVLKGQQKRIGKEGLENRLIGTVTGCNVCKASDSWLGRFSPIDHIRNGKLWLSQYLIAEGITQQDKEDIMHAITNTKKSYK